MMKGTATEPDQARATVKATPTPKRNSRGSQAPASCEVWVDRKPVSFSPKEQILFDLLYLNASRPCSKYEIATAVWPEYRAAVGDYQVEALVKRLREKLEPDPRSPVLILTVRGRGYKLAV